MNPNIQKLDLMMKIKNTIVKEKAIMETTGSFSSVPILIIWFHAIQSVKAYNF
jgi:hypothetical protein